MKHLLTALALLCVAAPSWAATCKISEYANLVMDEAGRIVPVAVEPSITTQNVTYTSSAQSAAFNANTRFIRIVCDAKAHYVFSANPTATAAAPYLAADAPEYFGVARGSSLEVAFYDGST